MNKRQFLGSAAAAVGVLPGIAVAADSGERGPTLLTVSGAIAKANRGALDPALDQMMVKHGVAFDKGFEFDAAALRRLPVTRIKPTLEYDAKPHELAGPLLAVVIEAAGGAAPDRPLLLTLRAVDGYRVALWLADVRAYRMIVATHIDGRPLGLGGLGPQWAVYDADVLAAFKDKPLKERFGLCPWALYHIDAGLG